MTSWGLKHSAVELLSRVKAGHLIVGAEATGLIAWHCLLPKDSFNQCKLLRYECRPTIFVLSFVEGGELQLERLFHERRQDAASLQQSLEFGAG